MKTKPKPTVWTIEYLRDDYAERWRVRPSHWAGDQFEMMTDQQLEKLKEATKGLGIVFVELVD